MKPSSSLLNSPLSKMPNQHEFAMARFDRVVATLMLNTPAVPKAMREHAEAQLRNAECRMPNDERRAQA